MSTAARHARTTAAPSATEPTLPFQPHLPARMFTDPHAITPPPAGEKRSATLADVARDYAAPTSQSPSNAIGDPAQNLQNFTLTDLAEYAKEKIYSIHASPDVHLFYVGRDDVHDVLKHILSRVTVSLYMNMFGYDDDELNNIVMQKVMNPSITVLITLDKSQAGGVHEKALLEADQKYNLAAFNSHFAIGESLTHQISHTKGFVADGRVAAEGSVNWSSSGEGTFVVQGQPGGPGYKAQNNTQSVITDPDTVVRFQTELISEHMTIVSAAKGGQGSTNKPLPKVNTPATQQLFSSFRAAASSTGPVAAPAAAAPAPAAPAPAPAAAKKSPARKGVRA